MEVRKYKVTSCCISLDFSFEVYSNCSHRDGWLTFFSFSKDFQREIIINILDESFLKLMFLQQQQQQQQQQQNVLLNQINQSDS